jgi:hypothetical protein
VVTVKDPFGVEIDANFDGFKHLTGARGLVSVHKEIIRRPSGVVSELGAAFWYHEGGSFFIVGFYGGHQYVLVDSSQAQTFIDLLMDSLLTKGTPYDIPEHLRHHVRELCSK